ncbi:sensor histidine kinase [Novosphingobium panipatense]|nr:histidine kinase [Novosphingobium panipatense]
MRELLRLVENLSNDICASAFSPEDCSAESFRLAILRARDDEARRIARDLHDVISQLLFILECDLKTMREGAEEANEAAHESARQIVAALQRQVRSFSYLLHPPELERLGLPLALNALATGMSARTGIDITFVSDQYEGSECREAELAIFRVAQAALMNVFKHSQACCADLRLTSRRNWIVLRVRDDGCGMQASAPARIRKPEAGVGLAGMNARMEGLSGRFSIRRRPEGTVLTAIVPRQSVSAIEPALISKRQG